MSIFKKFRKYGYLEEELEYYIDENFEKHQKIDHLEDKNKELEKEIKKLKREIEVMKNERKINRTKRNTRKQSTSKSRSR